MPHEIMTSSNTNCESKPQKPDSDCSAWWMTENYNKSVWFLSLCQVNFWVSVSVLHETVVATWWNERVFRGKRQTVVFHHSRLSCCLMFHICGFDGFTRESIWWLRAECCKRVSHQCHRFLSPSHRNHLYVWTSSERMSKSKPSLNDDVNVPYLI